MNKNKIIFSEEEKIEAEGMILNHEIVRVIKKLMTKKGKNRQEAAAALDISEAHLSKVFSSDKFVNVKTLVKFQRLFGTLFTFSAECLEEEKLEHVYRASLANNPEYRVSAANELTHSSPILERY